ncbi:MAG: ABC transporter permease [Saprospiraceae bacterium]|nr:ABC transporter permease [Saprospiraceae bacterium]MDZ4706396.1 ABC transporter permease [Saprospiraceae bacterium]
MLQYLLKRLLLFVPMLFVISFIAFGLNQCTPGDPVEAALEGTGVMPSAYPREYKQKAAALELDKPSFYFSLTAVAYPDTLYKIIPQRHRETATALIAQFGNWPEISGYLQQIAVFKTKLDGLRRNPETKDQFNLAMYATERLPQTHQPASIQAGFDSIGLALALKPALQQKMSPEFETLKQAYRQISSRQTRGKLYIPTIHGYGFQNRYHNWLIGMLKGDFGTSLKDGRKVSSKIKEAVNWTLSLSITAILLAYLLSVPIGVYSAVYQGSKAERVVSIFLFGLDSMPNFWMASLLIIFFTTPEYGMDFFRVLGPASLPADAGFWERFFSAFTAMILPVFCLAYGALAYISRQVRASMITALKQDYIRTARAKGLTARQVVWKHAFRNALFPLITMFASVFPAALAGSVIIEHIFNIPGMGQLMIKSIQGDDWPVIYTVLMLASLLTMIGILVADLLYHVADPRVDLNNKNRK